LSSLVSLIGIRGGVASVNHPFGTGGGSVLSDAAYRTKLSTTAASLLAANAYGAHVLEVGYKKRGQMSVEGHIDLWDILLSSGLRIMANGVSDNHAGNLDGWLTGSNRYFTDVVSDSADPADVVPLLSSGRCFVSLRPEYSGMLDLSCDDTLMGGVRAGTGSTATVTATADALPSGGSLRIVQMPVHGVRNRNTATPPLWERTVTPSQLTSGAISVGVTNVASYLRTEVRDADGTVVGFSNPLFLAP
ncbi:MAG TPA: hypothetical protein VHM65_05990, partial [Candidatus Lustribacter sp.]|nr:hypothetical protein [Candidatus Lustribacter sp.]